MTRGTLLFAACIAGLSCGGGTNVPPKPPPMAKSVDLATEVAALAPTIPQALFALDAWAALDDANALAAVDRIIDDCSGGDANGADFLCVKRGAALRLAQRARTRTLDLNADLGHRASEIKLTALKHIVFVSADVDRPRLRSLLDDPDPIVRGWAIRAIVRLRDTQASARLEELARSASPAFDPKELDPYTVVDERGVRVLHMAKVPPELQAREKAHRAHESMRLAACEGLRALGKPVGTDCAAGQAKNRSDLGQGPRRRPRNHPPDGHCPLLRSRLMRGEDAAKTLDDFISDRVKAVDFGVSLPFAGHADHPCPLPIEAMSKLRSDVPAVRQRLALVLLWDRHLLAIKSSAPEVALTDGFERMLSAELAETPVSMTFVDDHFPKDFVPTDELLKRTSFEARLVDFKRGPHPEHEREQLACYRVHVVNRQTSPGMPSFRLIDEERFRYTDEAFVRPARAKLCSADPGPRALRPNEEADVWVGFHVPVEARPIALHIYTSDLNGSDEVLDGAAIRLTP